MQDNSHCRCEMDPENMFKRAGVLLEQVYMIEKCKYRTGDWKQQMHLNQVPDKPSSVVITVATADQ